MKRTLFLIPLLLLLAPHAGAQTSGVTLPECSQARHDTYTIPGPDGASYPTWHPQVDYAAGCYFAHEHGSNPEAFKPGRAWNPPLAGAWPAYGYTAARMGMPEGHNGFKTYVLISGGYRWQLTHHFGSANPQLAACNQFHTLDIVAREVDGPIVADVHLMADFGGAYSNIQHTPLTPAACPNQATTGGADGLRMIPVASEDPAGQTGYEPWRVATPTLMGGAVNLAALTINTYNPVAACDAPACTANVARFDTTPGVNRAANGTVRFLTFNTINAGTWRIQATGAYSGTFYTDAHGSGLVAPSAAGSVRQYIAPGVTLTLPESQWWGNGSDLLERKERAQWDDWTPRLNPFIGAAN